MQVSNREESSLTIILSVRIPEGLILCEVTTLYTSNMQTMNITTPDNRVPILPKLLEKHILNSIEIDEKGLLQ